MIIVEEGERDGAVVITLVVGITSIIILELSLSPPREGEGDMEREVGKEVTNSDINIETVLLGVGMELSSVKIELNIDSMTDSEAIIEVGVASEDVVGGVGISMLMSSPLPDPIIVELVELFSHFVNGRIKRRQKRNK